MIKKSLIFVLIIAILVVIATLTTVWTGESITDISTFTASLTSTLRPFRWLFLFSIVAFWPFLIDFLARKHALDAERVAYGHSLRWRVGLYLIAFEFIVIEAVPARLLGL